MSRRPAACRRSGRESGRFGLLRPAPRHMPVEPIGHRRRREQRAAEPARLVARHIERRDDDRDRQDARQGQQIGKARQRHASLRRGRPPPLLPRNPRRVGGSGKSTGILATVMEMIINLFCDGFADAAHPLDLGEPGARHGSRRAEMVQQRVLALGADPGISSSGERPIALARLARCAPIAKRCASSRSRCRKYSTGSRGSSENGGRPGTKNRSRPALRSGPLAIDDDRRDRRCRVRRRPACAAVSWPCPPSISTRSGHSPRSRSGSSFSARPKRRLNTSRIIA